MERSGRALANLFASSPDHDFSQPESLYQQVALQFSLQVQRSANQLLCTSCSPTHTHSMNPTQLKLLIVLSIHGSLWIHSKVFAESYIVDCMWHIAQALHSCQVRLCHCVGCPPYLTVMFTPGQNPRQQPPVVRSDPASLRHLPRTCSQGHRNPRCDQLRRRV